ncbi:hypothetical protein HDK90DRAFT_73124 [Phyllosticta capitalensis]|uniref:Uncharacterized protein n=1 Tax=Phyllosticta capitalensis TaxID=121624 RepID=A0ABR1YDN9_9PEZI
MTNDDFRRENHDGTFDGRRTTINGRPSTDDHQQTTYQTTTINRPPSIDHHQKTITLTIESRLTTAALKPRWSQFLEPAAEQVAAFFVCERRAFRDSVAHQKSIGGITTKTPFFFRASESIPGDIRSQSCSASQAKDEILVFLFFFGLGGGLLGSLSLEIRLFEMVFFGWCWGLSW